MADVKMYGPSIRDPNTIVNRDVPDVDVQAYKAAGYKLGSIPEPETPNVEASVPIEPEASVETEKPRSRGRRK